MRDKTLRVRMNDDAWGMLERLAAKESLPIPEYVRFLIRKLDRPQNPDRS